MPTSPVAAIEPARAEHLADLRAIELSAAALLRGHAPDAVLDETTPAADLAAAVNEGRLWVALAADRPVGFALAERIAADLSHLAELDVEPAHGRRGLGGALVGAVAEWARRAGDAALTLTTFRTVPWLLRFYERLGFVEVPARSLRPELEAVVRGEEARGLRRETRIVMSLSLRARESLRGTEP